VILLKVVDKRVDPKYLKIQNINQKVVKIANFLIIVKRRHVELDFSVSYSFKGINNKEI